VVVVEDKDDVPLGRMTRLFPEDETLVKSHDKETDKDNDKKEEAEAAAAPSALFSTPQKPKKEGSGKFLGTPGSIQCSPSVKNAYSIVRRCTGSLGGNGSGGAIYGELTTGSMQKVVDVMIEYCKLGKDSIFIDVGAGLGKPNIHVAQYPGVAASYGIEHEKVRWQLSLHNLKHLLQAAEADAREAQVVAAEKEEAKEGEGDAEKEKEKEVVEEDQGKINHKIFFHYGDITEARTLDPFTHVYMFDIGFPPTLFYEIADRFNASRSPYLICYHGPKLIAERYGFNVELLHQIPTSMHGSSEGHQAYFYKRADSKPTDSKPKSASKGKGKAKTAAAPCDALFKDGLDLIRHGSLESLTGWVKNQMDNHFMSPRPARRRRSTNLFLNEI
jgi:hypothetical protein